MKSVIVTLLCVIVCVIRTADGLSCYQCGVKNTPVCDVNELGDLTSKACPADANNYCILVNASRNSIYTVQRFCSADIVSGCRSVPDPPGLIISSSCVTRSCNDRDGCNSARFVAMNIFVLLIALFISRILQVV